MKHMLWTLILITAVGCQKGGKSNLASDTSGVDDPFADGVSADDGLGGSLSGSLGGSNDISAADKTAVQNVAQENSAVAPREGSGIPQELLDEARALFEAEKRGDPKAQQMKMLLANKILQDCAPKVAALAPIPGEPLLGHWASAGGSTCPIAFDTSGPVGQGNNSPIYNVGNGIKKESTQLNATEEENKPQKPNVASLNGQMMASADGSAQVVAKPWQGKLTDQPSIVGSLTHPEFTKTKYGAEPCKTEVALQTSRNPIPEKFVEAMKKSGKCHRQALILMSPIFDRLFENLSPNAAIAIQGSALGIK